MEKKDEENNSDKFLEMPIPMLPEDTGIAQFMKKVFSDYEKIRGKDKNANDSVFWDVVVITTADYAQKNVFELQIESKRNRKELPLNLPIYVVADPVGPKIGNGGSTLVVLAFLHLCLGQEMFGKKILLIHAGGQSKRMPSASCLGKIFSPIPHGDPIYQMLDLKLAMYMPFLPNMPPGVFVACADDILVYDLGPAEDSKYWSFCYNGFTALAHPSPVQIGTKHGVYVVENEKNVDPKKHVRGMRCLRVLQKPRITQMYEQGAVLSNLTFSEEVAVKGDMSYTDSAFFFGMDVAKKLLHFYKENCPLTCEIDAYGDFLQALGPQATSDYVHNTKNVTHLTPNLVPTRLKIFELLKGTDISLLLMNASRFIHIGTTKEYIYHFCFDTKLQSELGLEKDCFNTFTELEPRAKKQKFSDTGFGCIMHSCLPSNCFVSPNTVVEYCLFEYPLQVGQNSIISNCAVLEEELTETPPPHTQIPHNLFLHTVAVKHQEKTKYATIVFHIEDDLKKQVPVSEVSGAPYLGYDIQRFIENCKLTQFELDEHTGGVEGEGEGRALTSLWQMSLFPLENTMTESLMLALTIVKASQGNNPNLIDLSSYDIVSMEEILEKKDVKAMLKFREDLFSKISKA
ncbi:fucose-1-phosphate guanylyltransferase-like [Saccostrea echinata]|uniref:fucose-1-phosphate guanylyltransferase-like n=1 Tax=Saccostrea echinata TaxID=191078 RepID=UPI002A807180|nr:fucose-1-phosphate guanylyltransferase-like [Saccostrea echinata]